MGILRGRRVYVLSFYSDCWLLAAGIWLWLWLIYKQNLSYLEPDESNDKPKPKRREPNLKHATSLSGTRQGLSGDLSQKKRKQK